MGLREDSNGWIKAGREWNFSGSILSLGTFPMCFVKRFGESGFPVKSQVSVTSWKPTSCKSNQKFLVSDLIEEENSFNYISLVINHLQPKLK